MGSLIDYDDMERLYETTGATLLRHPWGQSYDETIGPDPGGDGVVFPALGSLLPCPRTISRWVESPCYQPWLFKHPKESCEAWRRDCAAEVANPGIMDRIARALGISR